MRQLNIPGRKKMAAILQTTFSKAFFCVSISIKILLKLVRKVATLSALIPVMIWRLTGAKPLPEPMFTQIHDAVWLHEVSMRCVLWSHQFCVAINLAIIYYGSVVNLHLVLARVDVFTHHALRTVVVTRVVWHAPQQPRIHFYMAVRCRRLHINNLWSTSVCIALARSRRPLCKMASG